MPYRTLGSDHIDLYYQHRLDPQIPIEENGVAVYIYMAEGDEYYGSAKARSAYENLHEAFENAGWSDADIDRVLRIEMPDNVSSTKKVFTTTMAAPMWSLTTRIT